MERNEQINLIREKSDIVDIISSYIPLTPRGKNYFGVCPFHDDNHPSMSVSKEKQIYKCFSCGASGNVFQFIQDYEHISFNESLQILAKRAGIALNSDHIKTTRKNEDLYTLYEIAEKFYHNNILTSEGKKARDYLESRKINKEIIKEFGIGLSLKDTKLLSKIFVSKKYNEKIILNSGLVKKNNATFEDLYYNRIMFPLYNLEGNVVGFSGRIYDGTSDSKYINTRETEIFKKGELLYNYYHARNDARQKGQIIIVEGFMDVIRMYTADIHNVVATMGTAVTKNQALLIKRLAKEVILCFDGDTAGEKATVSCSEELLKIGVTPKVVRLEENLDPDEYILKYGKEKFKEKIDHAINLMDFKLNYYKKGKNLHSIEDTASYVNMVIEDLSKIEDDVLRELTIKKISKEANIDEEFLKSKVKMPQNIKKIEKKEQKLQKKENKFEKAQKNLVYYMLQDKNAVKLYIEKHPFIDNEDYRELSNYIVEFYKENEYVHIADILTSLYNNEKLMNIAKSLLQLDLKDEVSEEEISDYIKVIKEGFITNEIERLQEKIKEEQLPSKKAEWMNKIIHLKMEVNNL